MSRRWRYPRARRGTIRQVVPQLAPPPATRDQAGPRPRFTVRSRRGAFFAVPGQASPPATAGTRRRVTVLARRGRFLVVIPPPVVAPPPPSRPPDNIGHGRTRPAVVRRGRFTGTPQTAAQPNATTRVRARWLPAARRGRFFLVLPVPAPVAPPFVPQLITRRRPNPAGIRRGRYLTVPLTIAVPTPPPWVPPITSSHRPAPRPVRRGRFTVCPSGQTPPAGQSRRRPASIPARRGHRFDPPWTVSTPPASTRTPDRIRQRSRAVPLTPRRCRITSPPWPQIVQVPPAIVPTQLHTRRRLIRPRRGCVLWWPIFQAVTPIPTTTRGQMDGQTRSGPDADAVERPTPDIAAAVRIGAETEAGTRRAADTTAAVRTAPDGQGSEREGSQMTGRRSSAATMWGG